MTSVEQNQDYWDNFYKEFIPSVPSQFCAMLAVEFPSQSTVVELGCGNGRDSIFFASCGFQVFATDMSTTAIEGCKESADKRGLGHVNFRQGDLSLQNDIRGLFEDARKMSKDGKVIAYSRFVMHSISDAQEAEFMNNIGQSMKPGEMAYLEFRSKEDAYLEKTYGNHYRRFVDTDAFVSSMEQQSFKLIYRYTGVGVARYKSEDPFVSRLIFEKS